MRTTLYKGIEGSCNSRTVSAQFLAETDCRKMRFPKIIKHRRFEATIYGKSENYPYYRVAYYAAGKRHARNFKTFSEAKNEAERIVRDLAAGSQSVTMSADQTRDAITPLEMLEAFRQAGGRRAPVRCWSRRSSDGGWHKFHSMGSLIVISGYRLLFIGQSPGLLCMMPPSAKMVVAVR